MRNSIPRRLFLGAAPLAVYRPMRAASSETGKLAILGGSPVRGWSFPRWPFFNGLEENALLTVLRSGKWFRGDGQEVRRFEDAYARLTGAKYCIATANGTSALFASLYAAGVNPGDEVILPPYTFVATLNVVLLHHALPVFVDSDRETFQIDASKIEAAITPKTKAIMPVHLGGSAADLDTILDIGRRKGIPIIEDACQAHLAEWRNRKVGTWGATGCFSFQASKNLNCGEGGAILTGDEGMADRCYSFHDNGRPRMARTGFQFYTNGGNLRMTEFQGRLLQAQMTRVEEQSARREDNARYLTSLLKEIPGISPAKMYPGCTKNAYHLYMFRYRPELFAGAPRHAFLKALSAEGVPCSGGYSPLNLESFLERALQAPGYRRLFSENELASWKERTQCPMNDRLCEEAVWLTQNMLLGDRGDMDQIAAAIRKIQSQTGELRKIPA